MYKYKLIAGWAERLKVCARSAWALRLFYRHGRDDRGVAQTFPFRRTIRQRWDAVLFQSDRLLLFLYFCGRRRRVLSYFGDSS